MPDIWKWQRRQRRRQAWQRKRQQGWRGKLDQLNQLNDHPIVISYYTIELNTLLFIQYILIHLHIQCIGYNFDSLCICILLVPSWSGQKVFFRTAVGRKLFEICTVGWVKSERQTSALTRGPVYGVCIHMELKPYANRLPTYQLPKLPTLIKDLL